MSYYWKALMRAFPFSLPLVMLNSDRADHVVIEIYVWTKDFYLFIFILNLALKSPATSWVPYLHQLNSKYRFIYLC